MFWSLALVGEVEGFQGCADDESFPRRFTDCLEVGVADMIDVERDGSLARRLERY